MLDPKTTALVLIDLQKGIVANPQLAPRNGAAVIENAVPLARIFRDAGALVCLVHVNFAKDYADMPSRNVDQPMALPDGGLPDGWSDFADGVQETGDLVFLKRQWGAFTGTDLDLQLRRRGVKTIVLGGISTNIGVESTARHAWELGYDLQVVEDICAGPSNEAHAFAFSVIFPRISRVVSSAAVEF